MVENQEETIENWYFNKQLRNNVQLEKYLCEDHVLKHHDSSCLKEVYEPSKGDTGKSDL